NIVVVTKTMKISKPRTFKFEGVTMTHYFTDNWEKVKNFKAKPDDVVIATYPKAGTTWMSEIVDQLFFGEIRRESSSPSIFDRVPFLEFCEDFQTGTDQIESLLTSPRLIKTHLPVQLVPQSFWEQNCRMIYVARNPKDIMVSYYHFDRMNKIQPDPGAWEEYIDKFNTGQLVFGSWYDHVQGWWEKSRSYSRICYVFFEDMREISRLCSFLGLSPNETQKKEVLRKTGCFNSRFHFPLFPVVPGIVGDWKNHFTVAQNEAFNEEYRKKMKESDLKFKMEI
uniref:Sulfotransferase n=1 Tax=Scleropages formosus TaxID=113540 RepID=A0A8C9WTT1_SCLFO